MNKREEGMKEKEGKGKEVCQVQSVMKSLAYFRVGLQVSQGVCI